MIKEEFFEINGISHVRHYSDAFTIASDDGIEYEIAEDLASLGKVYHETDTPLPEASAEDIAEALEAIL